MCDTRLPLTECTPAAHHGRRFDIGASLPDLSPGPHLVPPFRVPSVPSYTPLPTLLPAYPPPCLRPALHAHEDVHHELRLTGATSTKRRTRHDDEGPWRCRGPCADLRRRRRRRRGGRRRPTCLSAISFFSLARPYLTSLTPIDAFILRPSPPQPAKCHFSRHRLNEAL